MIKYTTFLQEYKESREPLKCKYRSSSYSWGRKRLHFLPKSFRVLAFWSLLAILTIWYSLKKYYSFWLRTAPQMCGLRKLDTRNGQEFRQLTWYRSNPILDLRADYLSSLCVIRAFCARWSDEQESKHINFRLINLKR